MQSLPITLSWDEQYENCLRIIISSAWVWDDFYSVLKTSQHLIDTRPEQPIRFIFDVRQGHVFPRDMLYKVRHIDFRLDYHTAAIVIIGQGRVARALEQVLNTLILKPDVVIHCVQSFDEAQKILPKSTAAIGD